MDLQAIGAAVAQRLTDAGLQTVIDPRDLTTPGALLAPDTVELPTMGDTVQITWDLYLVAPDNGKPLATLGPLITALQGAGMPLDQARLEFTSVALHNLSPDPLPAMRGQFTTITTQE